MAESASISIAMQGCCWPRLQAYSLHLADRSVITFMIF